MLYLCSRNIYLSTTYHQSVYEITYENLGRIHPAFVTAGNNGEYNPYKKGMELEFNFLLTLSIIHPEIIGYS